jgi:hypothetical protein
MPDPPFTADDAIKLNTSWRPVSIQQKTPSFFVHVLFHHADASAQNYYLAGQVRTSSTNRILAQVRTSSSRSKTDFDTLAEKIELAWLDVVKGEIGDDKQ